jgi:hypothetical protein
MAALLFLNGRIYGAKNFLEFLKKLRFIGS